MKKLQTFGLIFLYAQTIKQVDYKVTTKFLKKYF